MARVDALLRQARGQVDAVDADWLLAHVLQRPQAWLFAHGDTVLEPAATRRYEALVARCAAGEPVAHLTGRRGFWTFDLSVTADTLVPRPETELLVEWALSAIPRDVPVALADLGTGSGAIALALAQERPLAQVTAVDASDAALAVARTNAEALGLSRIAFLHGDWCAPLAGRRFDGIASNPPYIRDDDPHLARGALPYEPRMALASGPDGLDAIRVLARATRDHLVDGGWLALEHGFDQGAPVRALLQAHGWHDIETHVDLEGRDRLTTARR